MKVKLQKPIKGAGLGNALIDRRNREKIKTNKTSDKALKYLMKDKPPIKHPIKKFGKGQLSIFREWQSGNGKHSINIVLGADKQLITMNVSLEDFSKCLTGMGVPTKLTVVKWKG